jgi:hypothetical protein
MAGQGVRGRSRVESLSELGLVSHVLDLNRSVNAQLRARWPPTGRGGIAKPAGLGAVRPCSLKSSIGFPPERDLDERSAPGRVGGLQG